MTRVLCVGAAVLVFVFHLDKLPDRAEKYDTETAEVVADGCAANAAVAVVRLGGRVVLGRVRTGTSPPARRLRDGLWSVIVGEAAEESARTGQAVDPRGGSMNDLEKCLMAPRLRGWPSLAAG